MKKLISVLTVISIIMLQIPAFAISGTGTEANPYLVSSVSDVLAMHNDLDGYYKLTQSIDMSGVKFEPIGNENEGAFTGTIDGGGYTISNLDISLPENKYVGFVGYLEGTVKNLTITNVNAFGYRYVGGVVGEASDMSIISDCCVRGSINGELQIIDLNVGGIVGYSNGLINNCTNYADVQTFCHNLIRYSTNTYAGGIVGCSVECQIQSSDNYGNIYSEAKTESSGSYYLTQSYAGGIAGYNMGNVYNCHNYNGIIHAYSMAGSTDGLGYGVSLIDSLGYVGAIIGYNDGNIDLCFNSANFSDGLTNSSNRLYLGGISGYNNGAISNCYNTMSEYLINRGCYLSCTGGITGFNYGEITSCQNEAVIHNSGQSNGGIAGDNNNIISDCINSGSVSGGSYSSNGGITGENYNGTISGCTNIGSVLGDNDSENGGIAGLNPGTISSCTNSGIVTSNGDTGGIAGENSSTISGCTNSGSITGNNYTGGIVGDNQAIIKNCLNEGLITGNFSSNGICSNESRYKNKIYNCKNTGTIISSDYACGICYGDDAYNCVNTGTINATTTYDITDGSIYNLTLSPYSVRRGSSVMMPIELYEYDRELTWSSSDNTVATVDPKGVVTGLKVGSVTITAVTELGISTSALLTVTEKLPDSITLSKQNITLQKGFTDRISVLFSPSDASDEVTLTSSNQDVATVTRDGLITALMPGSSTIKAETSNGRIAYCAVTVTEPNISVASVTLDKTSLTMMKDDTAQLNAAVLPENATNKTLIWSSSDESVAEVGGTGVVTAKESGVAVITATAANGMYHSCVVKVVSASGPSVVLSDANVFGYTPSGVTASIVKNPGISAYKFIVSYDEAMLTPVSVVPNEEFGGSFTTNLDDPSREKLTVLWYSDSDVRNDGELFTVNFKLNEGYTSGSCAVTLDYGDKDICNTAGDSIALYINDASVAVAKPVPGDVYEDGEVTVYDLTLLSRYVTGLEILTERQLEAADVNNDGDVDIKDVVRLAQHLAGWSNAELVSAAELSGSAAVTVGSAAADKNGEAEIPVSINGSGGISGFRYNLEYNSGELEILEIIPSELTKQTLQTNLGSENNEGLIVTWYKGDGDMAASGELFKIRARLKGDDPSRISIKANDNNMCDSDLNNVLGTYNAGTVTSYAAAPTATPTDVPTATPTDVPTATPTDVPTATPTDAPTATPVNIPTETPTGAPTPTDAPTETPSPAPTGSPDLSDVENIEPVGDYVGKVKITKTVKDDEITITVTGAVSGAGDVDLTAVTLYAAEYDETGEVLKELTLGEALVSDGILTLTTTIPESQNYKLLLWDNKFRPLTNAIIN